MPHAVLEKLIQGLYAPFLWNDHPPPPIAVIEIVPPSDHSSEKDNCILFGFIGTLFHSCSLFILVISEANTVQMTWW